jgi:hypothetical protein
VAECFSFRRSPVTLSRLRQQNIAETITRPRRAPTLTIPFEDEAAVAANAADVENTVNSSRRRKLSEDAVVIVGDSPSSPGARRQSATSSSYVKRAQTEIVDLVDGDDDGNIDERPRLVYIRVCVCAVPESNRRKFRYVQPIRGKARENLKARECGRSVACTCARAQLCCSSLQ